MPLGHNVNHKTKSNSSFYFSFIVNENNFAHTHSTLFLFFFPSFLIFFTESLSSHFKQMKSTTVSLLTQQAWCWMPSCTGRAHVCVSGPSCMPSECTCISDTIAPASRDYALCFLSLCAPRTATSYRSSLHVYWHIFSLYPSDQSINDRNTVQLHLYRSCCKAPGASEMLHDCFSRPDLLS